MHAYWNQGYPSLENAYINSTILYHYPSGIYRETNYSNSTSNPPDNYVRLNTYWDKLTGMLVKSVDDWFYRNETWICTISMEIVDSNVFVVIPEFPPFLIIPLFMVTTLLAVIVYRRKHSM